MGMGAGAHGLHMKLQDSDTLHMNVLMRDRGALPVHPALSLAP